MNSKQTKFQKKTAKKQSTKSLNKILDSSIINRVKNVRKTKTVKKKTNSSFGMNIAARLKAVAHESARKVRKFELKIVKSTKPHSRTRRVLRKIDNFEKSTIQKIKKDETYIRPLAIASVFLILFSMSVSFLSE